MLARRRPAASPKGISQSPKILVVPSPNWSLDHVVSILWWFCAAAWPVLRSAASLQLERRPGQREFGGCGLQRQHQLLAEGAQSFLVQLPQIALRQHALEFIDQAPGRGAEIVVASVDRGGEDRAVGCFDAIDIVAHVVDGGSADARFPAIDFAFADFV